MTKLAIVFLIGLVGGYTLGFRQASAGMPSVKERVLEKIGANRVRTQTEARQRAIDDLQRTRADSVGSAAHRTNPPR